MARKLIESTEVNASEKKSKIEKNRRSKSREAVGGEGDWILREVSLIWGRSTQVNKSQ